MAVGRNGARRITHTYMHNYSTCIGPTKAQVEDREKYQRERREREAVSFTPGPWIINGPWHVQAPTGPDNIPVIVAQVLTLRDGNRIQKEANARLISAAPELLEALQGLLSDWERVHGPIPDDHEAKAAIAKAGGKVEV